MRLILLRQVKPTYITITLYKERDSEKIDIKFLNK